MSDHGMAEGNTLSALALAICRAILKAKEESGG